MNHFYLLYLISISWLGDTFAYFGGKLFGRHKLNLPASPNKTLEGYLTGIVFAALGTFFLFYYLFPYLDWYDNSLVFFNLE